MNSNHSKEDKTVHEEASTEPKKLDMFAHCFVRWLVLGDP